jgi:hypothetical protein
MAEPATHFDYGVEPKMLDWPRIARAKRLLRAGRDLHEVAMILGVRARDLDLSLWRTIGGEGW